MTTLTCYFCEEQEEISNFEQDDISMFFCDDCQRWQCNTEECGCVCSATDGELFDWLVDAGTSPQEIILLGVERPSPLTKYFSVVSDSSPIGP